MLIWALSSCQKNFCFSDNEMMQSLMDTVFKDNRVRYLTAGIIEIPEVQHQ